jgi:hypothetical protein
MTAIKAPNAIANATQPGVPPNAPMIFVTNPNNEQIVVQHASGEFIGPQVPASLANVITISRRSDSGTAAVLSVQNIIDILPSLQAFVPTGVLA